MKGITKIVLVLCTVPLMAFTCTKEEGPNSHMHLDFTNASEKAIFVVNVDYYKSTGGPLEDYALSAYNYENLKKGNWSPGNYILPGQTVRIIDMQTNTLEAYLKMVDCWIFFILDAQTVENSTPQELTDGRAILDKIYYAYDDIQTLGTNLVFK